MLSRDHISLCVVNNLEYYRNATYLGGYPFRICVSLVAKSCCRNEGTSMLPRPKIPTIYLVRCLGWLGWEIHSAERRHCEFVGRNKKFRLQ